jgi:predicted DNA-binding antitoxin AbrB/MazE fold protein
MQLISGSHHTGFEMTMNSITAIYENGVFRPVWPVDLPENTQVEVILRPTGPIDAVQRARDMIAQGAAELDRDETVDADEVLAEIAARRDRIQAERQSET